MTRKGPFGPCWLLQRGCVPRSYPGSTPGINPRSQGVIPRRFKRKENFVTNRGGAWTHRREGGNSGLDLAKNLFASMIKDLTNHCTSNDLQSRLEEEITISFLHPTSLFRQARLSVCDSVTIFFFA